MSKTSPALVGSEEVSDDQLARYAKLVYERTGIRISPQKKALLTNRLRRRLRSLAIDSFDEYYNLLKRLNPDDAEWDAFLQEITTHETFLFRDEAQWEWFRKEFLPQRASDARAGVTPSLRIWSAACSTGDEAFTVACCIASCLPNHASWKIRILGTDIGAGALEAARTAVFGERSMKLVPEDYRRRFFTKAASGNIWQAKPILADMVAFKQHNLMDPLREPPFDLVLLKNVLIYFDTASKATVLKHVRELLVPGGLLLAGAAEGVSDLLKDFERVQPWLFRRPKRAGE